MILKNKHAIVTGASSGIGAELCRALISKGATVHALARRADRLQALHQELGERLVPVPLDVTDYQALEAWIMNTFHTDVSAPTDSNNVPHILVNNAGLGYFGTVDALPPEQWDTMMQTNLTSIFRLTRLIVPLMKQNNEVTHIINVASVAALIGNPSISGYNATKFGLRGFSEALMKELRNDRIKVTCVYPGSVATEFFDEHGGTHANMLRSSDLANTLVHVLETPDNVLIDEITIRPLIPGKPK